MYISEKKLRRIIKRTINEMSSVMPAVLMQRAKKCMEMSSQKLLKMCDEICHIRPDMKAHCFDLCYSCHSTDDMSLNTCCRCLEIICADPECCKICVRCCGC